MLNKIKSKINEPFIIYGTGTITTLLSLIYFSLVGYPLVNTPSGTLNFYTPPIYMIPIFFPYGILLGEFIWQWYQKVERTISFILLIECLIIGVISFIRISFFIPFSGHSIIIFFYLFHQIFNNRVRFKLRISIGMIILIITVIFKLVLWNDPITFLFGGLLGIILFLPGILYRKRRIKE